MLSSQLLQTTHLRSKSFPSFPNQPQSLPCHQSQFLQGSQSLFCWNWRYRLGPSWPKKPLVSGESLQKVQNRAAWYWKKLYFVFLLYKKIQEVSPDDLNSSFWTEWIILEWLGWPNLTKVQKPTQRAEQFGNNLKKKIVCSYLGLLFTRTNSNHRVKKIIKKIHSFFYQFSVTIKWLLLLWIYCDYY